MRLFVVIFQTNLISVMEAKRKLKDLWLFRHVAMEERHGLFNTDTNVLKKKDKDIIFLTSDQPSRCDKEHKYEPDMVEELMFCLCSKLFVRN